MIEMAGQILALWPGAVLFLAGFAVRDMICRYQTRRKENDRAHTLPTVSKAHGRRQHRGKSGEVGPHR